MLLPEAIWLMAILRSSGCVFTRAPGLLAPAVFQLSTLPNASPSVLAALMPAHPLLVCLMLEVHVAPGSVFLVLALPASPSSSSNPCFLAHIHTSLVGKYLY